MLHQNNFFIKINLFIKNGGGREDEGCMCIGKCFFYFAVYRELFYILGLNTFFFYLSFENFIFLVLEFQFASQWYLNFRKRRSS